MCWNSWGAAYWNVVTTSVRLPSWIVLSVWVFLDHGYRDLPVLLCLCSHFCTGTAWVGLVVVLLEGWLINFSMFVSWKLICICGGLDLKIVFHKFFFRNLILIKTPTCTIKFFAYIYWFSLYLFRSLWVFCQQILRNVLNYSRKIHKVPRKVYTKISTFSSFVYPDGKNNYLPLLLLFTVMVFGTCWCFIFYLRNPV